MDDRQRTYLAKSKEKYRGIFARAFGTSPSRPNAVKAMCISCVGQEDVKEQVGGCEITVCPLWPFRPYATRPKKTRVTKTPSDTA